MKEVNILGIPYTIQEKEILSNDDVMGDISYHLQEIRLKDCLPKECKDQTLIHEVVHGILVGLGELELNSNERLVQSLAMAIYLLIKNNDFSFMREEKTNEHRENLSTEKASDTTQS